MEPRVVTAIAHTASASDIEALDGKSFSTRMDADRLIVADRLMQRGGTAAYGAHMETANFEPSTTWYFAEGATQALCELFHLLQNRSPDIADVTITYRQSNGRLPIAKPIGSSRAPARPCTSNGQAGLESTEVAASITSTTGVLIVAERSMYFSAARSFEGGGASAGAVEPSTQWFLAGGAAGSFFSMFVLIGKPTAQDAHVHATYLRHWYCPREGL